MVMVAEYIVVVWLHGGFSQKQHGKSISQTHTYTHLHTYMRYCVESRPERKSIAYKYKYKVRVHAYTHTVTHTYGHLSKQAENQPFRHTSRCSSYTNTVCACVCVLYLSACVCLALRTACMCALLLYVAFGLEVNVISATDSVSDVLLSRTDRLAR